MINTLHKVKSHQSWFLITIFLFSLTQGYSATDQLGQSQNAPNSLQDTNQYEILNRANLDFTGFIENQGQIPNSDVRYTYSTAKSFIRFENFKVQLRSIAEVNSKMDEIRFEYEFINTNDIEPTGISKLEHSTNYFVAGIRLSGVPSYSEVWYYNIYDNIDLRYYMSQEGLKYEFLIHPGGNVDDILIKLHSENKVQINPEQIKLQDSIVIDSNLKTFEASGRFIGSNFRSLGDNRFGFSVNEYNNNEVLVIDPLVQVFSTYLGGTSIDTAHDVVTDSNGNVYTVGETESSDFPTSNAYTSIYQTNTDGFISKYSPTGSLIYTTYYGGSDYDRINAITVDSSNNIYIVGYTSSTDLPVSVVPYQSSLSAFGDGFVAKLPSNGASLTFSTYLGGDGIDDAIGVAVDSSNNIYIAGDTSSSDFPTTVGAYQTSQNGVSSDVFVTKFSSAGSSLIYSTYIGGSSTENVYDLAIDSIGSAFVVGDTSSSNFPTVSAADSTFSGSNDGIVLKLSATGSTLVFSTYLGGSSWEFVHDLVVDNGGNSYVTGRTESSDFAVTSGVYQSALSSGVDSFVVKYSSTGSLSLATYLGGSGSDQGHGIQLDSLNNIIIVGYTSSSNFPMSNAFQSTNNGVYDVFLTSLNPSLSSLIFSTYYGGTNIDLAYGLEIGSNNEYILVGETSSTDFPTLNAVQSNLAGTTYNAFVAKLVFDTSNPTINSPSDFSYIEGSTSNSITWTPVDSNPKNYSITRNLLPFILTTTWDGNPISITVDGLTAGIYNFVITVQDLAGNSVSDTVVVTVLGIDTTDPYISSPADFSYVEGTSGNQIIWYASDTNPDTYMVTRNGATIIGATAWSDGQIYVNVEGLPVSSYTFIITVYDDSGNSASDTVVVNVVSAGGGDTDPPLIDTPDNIIYTLGEEGISITWNPTDLNPYQYEILFNEGGHTSLGPWAGLSINVNVDGLSKGIYVYTLIVYDANGNSASDSVTVSVKGHGVNTDSSIELYRDLDLFLSGIPGSGTEDDPYIIETIELYGGKNIRISNTQSFLKIQNVIIDCQGAENNGISLYNVTNIRISNSGLRGCAWGGINIFESDQITINDNSFGSNYNGITISESSNIVIDANLIEDTGSQGIWVQSSSGIMIASNSILRTENTAISFGAVNNSQIIYNVIIVAAGQSWGAIDFGLTNMTTIESNWIQDSKANGISLDISSDNHLIGNEIFSYAFAAFRIRMGSRNTLAEWNVIYNMGETGVYVDDFEGAPHDTVVQYNDFYGSVNWESILFNDGIDSTYVNNHFSVYENTLPYNAAGHVPITDTHPSLYANHLPDFSIVSVSNPNQNGIITLDWSNVMDQSYVFDHTVTYQMYYSLEGEDVWKSIGSVDNSEGQWDTSKIDSGNYQVKIRAFDSIGFFRDAISRTSAHIENPSGPGSNPSPSNVIPLTIFPIFSIFGFAIIRKMRK